MRATDSAARPPSDRYDSLRAIGFWDHERVRSARVIVVGAGALGNEILKNLALLGIGEILVIDHDHVEIPNLSRSMLFRPSDAGRRKAIVAAERVADINPDVRIIPLVADVTTGVGLGRFRRADLVIAGVDNRAARVAVNRACARAQKPWIDGAIDVLMGTVRTFVPGGACYECGLGAGDYARMQDRYGCPVTAPPASPIPTTPTSASLIAALEVQEALKLLHGMPAHGGKAFFYDGQSYRTSLFSYSRRADCPAHEGLGEVLCFEGRAETATASAVLRFAAPHAGEDAMLLLDREVATTLYCPTCVVAKPIYRPLDVVATAGLACATCGTLRLPDITVRVGAQGEIGAVPLRDLGVPDLHVLRVEGARGRILVELSGDEESLFQGPGGRH